MCKKTYNGYVNNETEYMVMYIQNDQFLYNNCMNKSIYKLKEFFANLTNFLSGRYNDEDLELTGSMLWSYQRSYSDKNIQESKNDITIIMFDIGTLWRIDWKEVYDNIHIDDPTITTDLPSTETVKVVGVRTSPGMAFED